MASSVYPYKTLENKTVISNWSKQLDVSNEMFFEESKYLGFSIKSQLGSPSTLLNAGKTTNFIYEIVGANLSESQIEQINSIATRSKIMDRIIQIQKKGAQFNFIKTERQIF